MDASRYGSYPGEGMDGPELQGLQSSVEKPCQVTNAQISASFEPGAVSAGLFASFSGFCWTFCILLAGPLTATQIELYRLKTSHKKPKKEPLQVVFC